MMLDITPAPESAKLFLHRIYLKCLKHVFTVIETNLGGNISYDLNRFLSAIWNILSPYMLKMQLRLTLLNVYIKNGNA